MHRFARLSFAHLFLSSACTRTIRQLGLTILATGAVYLWIGSLLVAGALAQLFDAIFPQTATSPMDIPKRPSALFIDRDTA